LSTSRAANKHLSWLLYSYSILDTQQDDVQLVLEEWEAEEWRDISRLAVFTTCFCLKAPHKLNVLVELMPFNTETESSHRCR